MTVPPDPPETLPGLEAPRPGASALERAVAETLTELHAGGHIGAVDAGKRQLALEMAQIIASKRASGRASTVGNDARVLMEILDSFVGEASDVDADLEATMAEWSAAVARGTVPPVGAPGS